jgi:hypothetical protein
MPWAVCDSENASTKFVTATFVDGIERCFETGMLLIYSQKDSEESEDAAIN